MLERIHKAVLRHRDRCDYLEVRAEVSETTTAAVRDRDVETVQRVVHRGGIARALFRGGWGVASFNDLDALDEMISLAVTQARLVGTERSMLAEVPVHESVFEPELARDPRGVTLAERVDLVRGYADLALAQGGPIHRVTGRLEDSYQDVHLATSEGTLLSRGRMDLGLNLQFHARAGDVSEFCRVSKVSGTDFDVVHGLEDEVVEACGNAASLVGASLAEGGRWPVVLDPVLGGTFVHEAFGHTSEADAMANNPALQDVLRVGREIGRKGLTLYDSGLDADSRGYVPFDDEGVAGRRTDLVVDGVVAGHLHSRETAARMGTEATGNARAVSYRFPPIVRMRNTCVAPGSHSFEELLDGIDDGIYAVGMHGGTGGESFTFSAERGYRIRGGEVGEMVRGVKLSGSLFDTLLRIDRIGSDFSLGSTYASCGKGGQYPLPVGISAPHFRIDGCIVGGGA